MSSEQKLKIASTIIPGLKDYIDNHNKTVEELKALQAEFDLTSKQKQRLENRIKQAAEKKAELIWPLLKKELLKSEFSGRSKQKAGKKHSGPLTFNWIVLRANLESGGQEDIFRTIQFLADKGHDCKIYVYDVRNDSNVEEQKEQINSRYPRLKAEVAYNSSKMRDCDAIFATHWVTAYPVYNFEGTGKKYYYIQDFEPFFEPAGYINHLAAKTYSFGFKGLTLGNWLSEKISKEYGMECDPFAFGHDPQKYFLIKDNQTRSNDVLYYMRPRSARRGVELAILALEIFHKQNPESKIHLFGSDTSDYKIPFPHEGHGVLNVEELNSLYNRCKAGLILSFTNMSLIPLEMLASGCMPVVNDDHHTRKVAYEKLITYAEPSPQAMADALGQAVRNSQTAKFDPSKFDWTASNQHIENILIKDLS